MRRKPVIAIAAVAGLVLAGGVAYASIPDAGGVIHGCYQKNNGQLRVIDPASDSCRSSEAGLDWNQVGVRGPTGSRGPTGAAGADGKDGKDGVDGKDGKDGAAGPTGPTGRAGNDGRPGSDGARGPTGPPGSPGAAGGLTGYEIVDGGNVTVPPATIHEQFIACPAGKKALGFSLIDVFTIEVLKADLLDSPTPGLLLIVRNNNLVDAHTYRIGVTCATAV